MNNNINKLFFELIRVAIGNQVCLSRSPSADEWGALYAMAKKQSIVGICFAGLQKLYNRDNQVPSTHNPQPDSTHNQEPITKNLDKVQYLKWMGMAAKIQQRNEVLNCAVGSVRSHFGAEGFDMVLLKGQGNLCNYSKDLCLLRNSGDIDVWAMPKGIGMWTLKERLKNDEYFLKWLWKKDVSIRHCYIHVVYPQIDAFDVEVHFRPSYLNSPLKNIKFQRWMMEEAPEQIEHIVKIPHSDVEVAIPTIEFNLVYQLNHLYRHLFDDGIGLRQVLDYYCILKAFSVFENRQEIAVRVMKDIESFGMKKFCRALMYVMQDVFGMNESWQLCEQDMKAGEFLLSEIMQAGNFGHYDVREKKTKKENGVQRLIRRQRRNMRFFSQYTEEVISVPIYRIYQEYWRIKMKMKCK